MRDKNMTFEEKELEILRAAVDKAEKQGKNHKGGDKEML